MTAQAGMLKFGGNFRGKMKRQSNIICPYCPIKLHRWAALKTHIETEHPDQEVPEWVLNSVNPTRRKGQIDYRKGELKRAKPKSICPKCGEDLQNCYKQVKGKMIIIGLVCPNEECEYIKKKVPALEERVRELEDKGE